MRTTGLVVTLARSGHRFGVHAGVVFASAALAVRHTQAITTTYFCGSRVDDDPLVGRQRGIIGVVGTRWA